MQRDFKTIWRWLGLILWFIGLFCVFYFHLYRDINLASLKQNYQTWKLMVSQHYLVSVLVYMGISAVLVALALPVAALVAIAGGMLFGVVAIFYALVSVTVGSAITFLIVRNVMNDWLVQKMSGRLARLEKLFEEHAFYYLIGLRILPIFPFWLVNVGAGLLAVRFRIFVLATFFGMIPIKIIYVWLGSCYG